MLELSPWPWFVAGPIIAAVMVILLLSGRRFGLSSNLRTLCHLGGAGRWSDYFHMDWRKVAWNLVFVAGTIAGGAIARFALLGDRPVELNPNTTSILKAHGIADAGMAFLPSQLFSSEAWTNPWAVALLMGGGMLVGFGTRWANGCTSGHAISGLSSLQWSSLVAVIGFFAGGLAATHFILPTVLSFL